MSPDARSDLCATWPELHTGRPAHLQAGLGPVSVARAKHRPAARFWVATPAQASSSRDELAALFKAEYEQDMQHNPGYRESSPGQAELSHELVLSKAFTPFRGLGLRLEDSGERAHRYCLVVQDEERRQALGVVNFSVAFSPDWFDEFSLHVEIAPELVYVRPQFRHQGAAFALLHALARVALSEATAGLQWLERASLEPLRGKRPVKSLQLELNADVLSRSGAKAMDRLHILLERRVRAVLLKHPARAADTLVPEVEVCVDDMAD